MTRSVVSLPITRTKAALISSSVRYGVRQRFFSLNFALHCQMTRRYLSVLCQTLEPYQPPQQPQRILVEKWWSR